MILTREAYNTTTQEGAFLQRYHTAPKSE